MARRAWPAPSPAARPTTTAIRAFASSAFPMKECADVACAASRSIRRPIARNSTRSMHQFGRELERAHHRAVPRRRRIVSSAQGVLADAASVLPRDTTSCSFSMRCRRTSAAPATCSRSRPMAWSRTSSCSARAWAMASRSRRRSAAPICSRSLDYGEGSDTWSANPLCCAAVLATLDEFAAQRRARKLPRSSAIIEEGWCD